MINAETFFSSINNEKSRKLIYFEGKVIQYFEDLKFFLYLHNQQNLKLEKYTSIHFNYFKYFFFNENYFSDIIADILNPKGEHGQGTAFLNAFIDLLNNKKGCANNTMPYVNREAYTKQFKRPLRKMDILIDWSDFGIMIENKPKNTTIDQKDQLEDYSKDLTNKYGKGNFILIYLSNEGRDLSVDSISDKRREELEKANQFLHFTYQNEFSVWIQNCINICQSDKYRWFLKDFHSYIINNYLKS